MEPVVFFFGFEFRFLALLVEINYAPIENKTFKQMFGGDFTKLAKFGLAYVYVLAHIFRPTQYNYLKLKLKSQLLFQSSPLLWFFLKLLPDFK